MKNNSVDNPLCKDPGEGKCSVCHRKIIVRSLVFHLCSTLVKASIGVITGSQVLIADAVHAFTDSVSYGINYYGSRFSRTGVLYQGIFIGSIMFLSGMWICADNIDLLITGTPVRPGLFAIIVAAISIAVNTHLYKLSVCASKITPDDKNLALCLSQNKVNIYAAGFSFTGIFLADIGLVRFDPFFAIFIGIAQLRGAFDIFDQTFVEKHPLVKTAKRLTLGSLLIISAVMILFFMQDTTEILKKRAIILIPSQGILAGSPVDELLGRARYFYIVDTRENTSIAISNTSRNVTLDVSEHLLGIVKENNVGTIIAQKIGGEIYSDLSNAKVKMFYAETPMTVSDAFSAYQNKVLKVARASNTAKGFGRSKVRFFSPW